MAKRLDAINLVQIRGRLTPSWMGNDSHKVMWLSRVSHFILNDRKEKS